MTEKIFPSFVFERRRDIELETGLTLAGHLVVNGPPSDPEARAYAASVIRDLIELVRSGQMRDRHDIVWGWPVPGGRPPNAVDTDDDKLMAAWAKDRLHAMVRVTPDDVEGLPIDSEMMEHLGLAHAPPRGHQ
jgi:hypothetical protein